MVQRGPLISADGGGGGVHPPKKLFSVLSGKSIPKKRLFERLSTG